MNLSYMTPTREKQDTDFRQAMQSLPDKLRKLAAFIESRLPDLSIGGYVRRIKPSMSRDEFEAVLDDIRIYRARLREQGFGHLIKYLKIITEPMLTALGKQPYPSPQGDDPASLIAELKRMPDARLQARERSKWVADVALPERAPRGQMVYAALSGHIRRIARLLAG